MCNCKYGGGPNGICAFHRHAAAQAKAEQKRKAREKWIINQIKKLAEKLNIDLDPLP